MAVDRFELLAWLVRREDDEPGVELSGATILTRAAHLNAGDEPAAMEVARAAGELRRLGWIDWRFDVWPGRLSEPPPHVFDDQVMHRVDGIVVAHTGHAVLAARCPIVPTQQINITQSTVGQLALGNIANIDILLILEAAERCLDEIDAPEDAKDEARGVLRRMREAGSTIAARAAGSVLATAVRQALGLP